MSSGRRGSVDVRLEAQNGHVRFEVSDTGIGISEAEQARLFERFFRTEAASGQSFQGAGLGLAISKSIVEAHGGQIAVASAKGSGRRSRSCCRGSARLRPRRSSSSKSRSTRRT